MSTHAAALAEPKARAGGNSGPRGPSDARPRARSAAHALARAAAFVACASSPQARAAAAARGASEPRIVYLNFSDGTETITRGELDDAPANVSSIGRASPYPAFSWPSLVDGSETRADLVRRIAREVHRLFLPFNVLITTTRPPTGPYTMVLLGGFPTDIGLDRLAGVAYLDCEDAQDKNLVFVFPPILRGNERALVMTIAQETAHAFGLEHTSAPEDVMYPTVDPRQAAFLDVPSRIFGEHHCGNEQQRSRQKLLDIVGPWRGEDKPLDVGARADRLAPTVSFVSPAAGARLPQPAIVRIVAADDVGIDRVVLAVGRAQLTLRREPFAWALAGLDAGPTTLVATAYDLEGNVAVAHLEVLLEGAAGDGQAWGCAVAPEVGRGAGGDRIGALGVLAALWGVVRRAAQRASCRAPRAAPRGILAG
jgi:hypothetical protein